MLRTAAGAMALSMAGVTVVLVRPADLQDQQQSARLADRLVLDESGAYHTRHSVLAHEDDAEPLCAPELRYLYRQVFDGAQPE